MKRFFTFLMAVWALLSISQTVKAADEVYLLTGENINGAGGSYDIPSNHKMEPESGDTYKIKIESSSPDVFYFRVGVNSSNKYQLAPSTDQEVLSITEEGASISAKSASEKDKDAWKVSFDKNTYEYITIHVVIKGETKVWVDGKKKDSGTVTPPTPSGENPIANRKYSEGYYLVGNFFNFDGDDINYKDAVFKFKQQNDDEEGNAVYMLEIPATLTARAQVMSVDATRTPVAVYGPGIVRAINNSTLPVGEDNQTATTGIQNLTPSTEIVDDGTNCWDMTTRRTKSDGVGQDGSYKYYITVDKATGEPSKWEIKYTDLKRVAFLLSTNPLSSALTVGSTRVKNTFEGPNDVIHANFSSGKYFGSLYMDTDDEYYGVSNDLAGNNLLSSSSYGYKAITNEIDRPTYNKLFLFGNGGLDITQSANTQGAANWGTFKCSTERGVYILEFNTNKGNNTYSPAHGGTGAEFWIRSDRKTINSLSMVGPAIPGTTTADGKWNWASDVADMDFDVSENCYKLTIATTDDNKNQVFRFVGNHTQMINWFENSNVVQSEMAAEYNDDGTFGIGHTASPSDPNEVSYTQNGLDPKDKSNEDNLDIRWNRPAGTWTVRFHIYTYSQDGNTPSFRYFYTINKNSNLELRDFKDVVYMSEENVRNIKNRGVYQYFRTWSDNTAWKRPKNVDVFVVSEVTAADANNHVGFKLKNINNFDSSEDVIPAYTGVILALKENVEVPGAVFHKRKSLITYNTLDIQLEQAKNKELSYTGEGKTNLLIPCDEAKNIPTADEENVNYLFGFYHAIHGLGLDNATDKQGYNQNDYLLGFWISNGKGLTYANSSYLHIKKEIAEKLNLGTSNDFSALQNQSGSAKKIPALFFDFGAVDNDVTGIQGVVESKTVLDGKYYTLSGQQVEHPTVGGIYIHNGKKYVIK